jgi:3-oxoacyl-[acyl-carrier-protein] synthase II
LSRFERSPKKQRRVVVTGVGTVTPLGLDAQTTWRNLLSGESGIAKVTRFDVSNYDCQIAGELKNFSADAYVPKKEQKKMDLFIQYAMAAAEMAVQDSKIPVERLKGPRVGVLVGAGIGGLPGIEDAHTTLMNRGPGRVSPFFIPHVISNLAGGQIAIKYGSQGPNFCVVSACATGAHSIGEAAQFIRDGVADVMIAGGTESTISPLAMAGFASMRAMSTRNDQPTMASRPFDKDRDGFVMGEGAGVLILEDLEFAEKRNANILAEVTGYGLSCDAFHMTGPSPEGDGAARSMRMAVMDAGLTTESIDYINAHGTSTPMGDEIESKAVKAVFGDHAYELNISSTKSMTGHLLGAAGAIESVFCIYALKEQIVPPTINLENAGEGCDLNYTPLMAQKRTIRHALNNSFGFGGTNCSLVFSLYR